MCVCGSVCLSHFSRSPLVSVNHIRRRCRSPQRRSINTQWVFGTIHIHTNIHTHWGNSDRTHMTRCCVFSKQLPRDILHSSHPEDTIFVTQLCVCCVCVFLWVHRGLWWGKPALWTQTQADSADSRDAAAPGTHDRQLKSYVSTASAVWCVKKCGDGEGGNESREKNQREIWLCITVS